MPGVPAFILRRLYAKSSLHNREDGWGFELKNNLGSGYAKELLPLTLDGSDVPRERSFFEVDGRDVAFSDVGGSQTFALKMNRTILISVRGEKLSPGAHKVGMAFVVPGFGKLAFDFTDSVRDGPSVE